MRDRPSGCRGAPRRDGRLFRAGSRGSARSLHFLKLRIPTDVQVIRPSEPLRRRVHQAGQEPDRRGRSVGRQRGRGQRRRGHRRRARERRVGRGAPARRQARPARPSGVADRGRGARPLAARDPLLRLGQPLRAGRQDAARRPGLRARRVDDRRLSRCGRTAATPSRSRARSPPEQRQRYSRHFLLPEVGVEGQQKLLDAKVLLLGAGGLGSPTALYLAAAGVGTLGIVDDDVVDVSNLQRQVIHTTDRVGVPKVDSAEQSINDAQPGRRRCASTRRAWTPRTSSTSSRTTTSSSTASTTSRRATCSTTRRCA